MKKIIKIVAASICMFAITATMPAFKANAAPVVSVSFQVFFDDLAPYGQWLDDPDLGYVWIPSVGNDFRPYYSDGYWVMTQYGNMWVSNYDWGWAPFHYGRWAYDSYYGWIWVPDTEWGPAWVVWRSSPGYYGWAPLGPRVTVAMAFNSYYPPDNWWVFIPPTHIYNHHWHRYYEGPGINANLMHQTTIIHNSYNGDHRMYISGPNTDDVKRTTHQNVQVYQVSDDSRPQRSAVNNNSVTMYRPSVERKAESAPREVRKVDHPIANPDQKAVNRNTNEGNQVGESRTNREMNSPQPKKQAVMKNSPGNERNTTNKQVQNPQPKMQGQSSETPQNNEKHAKRTEVKQKKEETRNDRTIHKSKEPQTKKAPEKK